MAKNLKLKMMNPSTRSLVGKIASLPNDIREQINCRLRDGQTASLILPWLNALPPVQKILAGQFAGAPINSQNLCNWRASGYQRWLAMPTPLAGTKEILRGARHFARVARGIAPGAAAIAANHLFQSLCPNSGKTISHDDFLKIFPSVTTLLKADQNHLRLKLAKRKVRQKDAHLLLTRDKHQRDMAAVAIRSVHDEHVRLIEAASISYEEKIELVGRHLFGKLWEPRLIPPLPEITVLPENSN